MEFTVTHVASGRSVTATPLDNPKTLVICEGDDLKIKMTGLAVGTPTPNHVGWRIEKEHGYVHNLVDVYVPAPTPALPAVSRNQGNLGVVGCNPEVVLYPKDADPSFRIFRVKAFCDDIGNCSLDDGDAYYEGGVPVTIIEIDVVVLRVNLERCAADWDPRGGNEANWTTIRAYATPNTVFGRFKFILDAVSDEKGYCLNRPLSVPSSGPDSDAWKDLQFQDPQYNPSTGFNVSGANKDVAETSSDIINEATVRINSFDYGSYGKLTVQFTTTDGSLTCTGNEEGAALEYTRLPRDADGNYIRDGAAQNSGPGTSNAASDDNEELPTGRNVDGDKLSRYEEYRGFVNTGGHFRTDVTKKTVMLANGTEETWPTVTFGVSTLGYDLNFIDPASDMTADQVINGNRETPAGALEMYAVLLQEADLPLYTMGSTLPYVDTKARCRFDFTSAEIQSGGDIAYKMKIKKYMFAHEIGHALYLEPPSFGGMFTDGHDFGSLKNCFMDLRDPYDDTPPTSYCTTPGVDGYNCSVKHSVKGP
jgi:hypothetical protein